VPDHKWAGLEPQRLRRGSAFQAMGGLEEIFGNIPSFKTTSLLLVLSLGGHYDAVL